MKNVYNHASGVIKGTDCIASMCESHSCPCMDAETRHLTHTELGSGEQRVDPCCFVRRRYPNFPTPKPGRDNKGPLHLWGSQTSCQPQLAPPRAHLESVGPCVGWISRPRWHIFFQIICFLELFHLPSSRALHPPTPVQAHRTRRVFHPAARQASILGQNWVPVPTAMGQLSDLQLSPPWHCQRCVQATQTYLQQQALREEVVRVMYYDTLKNAGRIHCFSVTGHKQQHNRMFTRVSLCFAIYTAIAPTSSRPVPGPTVDGSKWWRLYALRIVKLQILPGNSASPILSSEEQNSHPAQVQELPHSYSKQSLWVQQPNKLWKRSRNQIFLSLCLTPKSVCWEFRYLPTLESEMPRYLSTFPPYLYAKVSFFIKFHWKMSQHLCSKQGKLITSETWRKRERNNINTNIGSKNVILQKTASCNR